MLNFVERARNWLAPQRKQQMPGGGYMLPLGGGYIPPEWPVNFWQTGYDPLRVGGGAIVHACVAAYAQTVAMCPGTHWRATGDGGRERITNSALSRVLKRPNAYQSGSDFWLNLTGWLYEDGNAYAYAIRNNRYEISELHLMDSRTSAANVASNGEIFYSIAGNPIVDQLIAREDLAHIPARDVLHIRLDSRSHRSPLRGEPPLTSALLDIAASNQAIQSALAYTANQSRPSGVIQTDLQLDEQQRRELRAAWDEQTRGSGAGGTPILSWGLKWQQVSITSRDAQLAEMLQISDARIATAYRVPLELLSLWGAQGPQAATGDLIRTWVAQSLGFTLNHIEDPVSRFFGLGGFPDEYLEFDTAALLRSNQRDRIEALARGVQGGIYSPNEARALEDLPAAKDGDEPRVQQQVVPLSFGTQPPPPPVPPTPPPTDNPDVTTQLADRIRRAAAARLAA